MLVVYHIYGKYSQHSLYSSPLVTLSDSLLSTIMHFSVLDHFNLDRYLLHLTAEVIINQKYHSSEINIDAYIPVNITHECLFTVF